MSGGFRRKGMLFTLMGTGVVWGGECVVILYFKGFIVISVFCWFYGHFSIEGGPFLLAKFFAGIFLKPNPLRCVYL